MVGSRVSGTRLQIEGYAHRCETLGEEVDFLKGGRTGYEQARDCFSSLKRKAIDFVEGGKDSKENDVA